jgi:RimJ/RimL family protein N-acetyltransferase
VAERVVLHGARVVLQPLDPTDVAALHAAASEDRATYAFTTVPATEAAMRDYVAEALAEEAAGRALPFAIIDRATGRVVGSTRFLDIQYWPGGPPRVPTVVEIGGTWLASSAQRTSINTECKVLLLTHAFDTWHVHRVCLKTDVRNERSRRAIERLGASYEGVRRAHKPATDGGIRDSAYYSITAPEWPDVRAALQARLAGADPRDGAQAGR